MAANNKVLAKLKSAFKILGPGLVTGSSDDDPLGIATYLQVGTRFGLTMTLLVMASAAIILVYLQLI